MLNQIQNANPKRLILTALDNNRSLWFDNFIPFVLSLRETNYQGEIGVLDYGLSEEHKKRLISQRIRVFTPVRECEELLLDRHLSAGAVAEQYGYDYVAVYDADIWFAQGAFTLFEQLQDPNQLYCTYDAWFCSFLTDCVKPEYQAEISQKLQQLTQQTQYAYQVGLLAGHKQAWHAYRDYVRQQLASAKFFTTYGIDTTLLNLYALDCQQIAFLHQKYNCVPIWGVQHLARGQFQVFGQAVEGLHITRNHRQDPLLTYHNLFADQYYQKGKDFQLTAYTNWHITRESVAIYPIEEHHTVLRFDHLHTNTGVTIGLEQDWLYLDVGGESKICLQNDQEQVVRLVYFYQSRHNKKIPHQHYVSHKPEMRFTSVIDCEYYVDIQPNQCIEFVTRDLDVENTGLRWCFKQLRLR